MPINVSKNLKILVLVLLALGVILIMFALRSAPVSSISPEQGTPSSTPLATTDQGVAANLPAVLPCPTSDESFDVARPLKKNIENFDAKVYRYDDTQPLGFEYTQAPNIGVAVSGYFNKNRTLCTTVQQSFMVIYDMTAQSYTPIYQFAPHITSDKDLPQLLFQSAWFVPQGDSKFLIVTAWNQIGADYFGAYPMLFTYDHGTIKPTAVTNGDLATQAKTKGAKGWLPNVTVKNLFANKELIKTILTHDVSIQKNTQTGEQQLKLNFSATDTDFKCRESCIDTFWSLPK